MSTADLRELASDASKIPTILDELRHRTTKASQKLRVELTNGKFIPGPARSKTYGSHKDSDGAPAESAVTPQQTADQRFEVLRSTFTLEAEILARWGVTPLLPAGLLGVVIEGWRSSLTMSPDVFGRSLGTLESDLARLAAETANEIAPLESRRDA